MRKSMGSFPLLNLITPYELFQFVNIGGFPSNLPTRWRNEVDDLSLSGLNSRYSSADLNGTGKVCCTMLSVARMPRGRVMTTRTGWTGTIF